jgi:hypothetical protein
MERPSETAALGPVELVSPGKSVAVGHVTPNAEQVQYKLLLVLFEFMNIWV